jgi:hypothetical protein
MHTLRQCILAHVRILIAPLRLAWQEGRNRWTLLLLAALLPAVALNAQVTTGSVNGRVQDPTTGRFLNNAKVSVVGSTATTQTDEYGEYQLNGIPAGVAKLKAFYTGLGEQEVAVTVQAGKTVTQDIVFDEKAAGESSVVLDTFTVASHRNTDVASIAVNEQRFSPNIKTVIETDAFGDIAEGNIGEFLKFLPGVTVDYVAADVRTVSVRGFGSAFSSVSIDGFRMPAPPPALPRAPSSSSRFRSTTRPASRC